MSILDRILQVRVRGEDFGDPTDPNPPEVVAEREIVPGPRFVHKIILARVSASDFEGSSYPENVANLITLSTIPLSVTFGLFEVETEAAVLPNALIAEPVFGEFAVNPPPDVYVYPLELSVTFGEFLVQDNGVEIDEFSLPIMFGTLEITTTPTVQPASIELEVTFGEFEIFPEDIFYPDAISEGIVFGAFAVAGGAAPNALTVNPSFGIFEVRNPQQILPSSLTDGPAFGTFEVKNPQQVFPSGFTDGPAFGTLTISNAAIDPATLSWTGAYKGSDYNTSTDKWTDTANVIEGPGNPADLLVPSGYGVPSTTTQNSRTVVRFVEADYDALTSAATLEDYINDDAYTLIQVFRIPSYAVTGESNVQLRPSIVAGAGRTLGLVQDGANGGTVTAIQYDGSSFNPINFTGVGTGWHVVTMTYNGTTLKARIDGGSWSSATPGADVTLSTLATSWHLAGNPAVPGNVDIAAWYVDDEVKTDATINGVEAYLRSYYNF